MPHKGYSTPSQNFDHRRKTQKVFVDRASGDVILRLHETDIVRVTPRGDVVLSTGGWATDKTLNSMNDALELFGMWVEVTSGSVTSGRWQVTDSDGTIHPYNNNKSSFRIIIPAKSVDDAPRASWLADAYEVQYTPRPAAAPAAAQGPRIAAAPAAAPVGTSAGPRIAAAPAAGAAPARSNGVAAAPAATARPPGIGGSWANIAKSSNPLHQASTGPSSAAAAHNVRVTGPGAASAGRVTGPGATTSAAAAAGPPSSSAAPHRTTGPPGFSTGPGSSAAHAGARPPGVRPPSAAAAAGAAPSPQRATVTSAPPPPAGGGSSASLHQQFAAMGMHDADDDTHLCVVCMEEPRSIVLVPCGHMALCKGCCEQIVASQQKCPMCCQDVEYHVEVDA